MKESINPAVNDKYSINHFFMTLTDGNFFKQNQCAVPYSKQHLNMFKTYTFPMKSPNYKGPHLSASQL